LFFSFSCDGVLDLLGFGYLVECVFLLNWGLMWVLVIGFGCFYCFVLGY
jgi:hypothetical protein